MRHFLIVAALVIGCRGLQAAQETPVSVARLLDEIIARPGDYAQICDAPLPVPYDAPPIPAYGFSVPQTLFPSEDMLARLKARREEVIKEIGARLEKLDWLKPPPAPAVSKTPLFVKPEPNNPEFDPTKPSGQNSRTLQSILLNIVDRLDGVELLPQLMRLEDDLHRIGQEALQNEKTDIPAIDIGGFQNWEGAAQEYSQYEDWEKAPAEVKNKMKHKEQVFNVLVFDRQILGVMLRLLRQKNFGPLQDSTPGLMRAVVLRLAAAKNEDLAKIKSPEDIPPEDRPYLTFEKDLGVPAWRYEHANMLYSENLRQEVRGLVQAYLGGTLPPKVSAEQVLANALKNPGNFNQMCSVPGPLPFDVPIPAYGELAPRHFTLSQETKQSLQARRPMIVPLLAQRFRDLDLSRPEQRAEPPALSLLLSVVRTLHAVEVLPDLLRLEEQLHATLAAADKDVKAPLPLLNLGTPVFTEKAKDGEATENRQARFAYRVLQRELLGLIGQLLKEEQFGPYLASQLQAGYHEALRKEAREGSLKNVKDISAAEALKDVEWDQELDIPVRLNGTMKVPYTEALREDIRKVAEEFLKTVPPEKQRGENAMNLVINVR